MQEITSISHHFDLPLFSLHIFSLSLPYLQQNLWVFLSLSDILIFPCLVPLTSLSPNFIISSSVFYNNHQHDFQSNDPSSILILLITVRFIFLKWKCNFETQNSSSCLLNNCYWWSKFLTPAIQHSLQLGPHWPYWTHLPQFLIT